MSKQFDSVIASPMRGLVRSPLGVLDTGVSNRAVYIISRGFDFESHNNPRLLVQDETLFRLSLDDLATATLEKRPPWWPAPHPIKGQEWQGDIISGDANTVWYSAVNSVDLNDADSEFPRVLDQRWTIDIYKLDSNLEVVNSWRWPQPSLGGGRAWHIAPFGDSTALWGLASVHESPEGAGLIIPQEMYLVELDPETMAIRRVSPELLLDFPNTELTLRIFARGGGGTADAIWLAWRRASLDPDLPRSQSQIVEYDPTDFRRVRITDGPRSVPFEGRRDIGGIGGDSQSIWLSLSTLGEPRSFVSELPRDYTNENRTIIQDEIIPPRLTTFETAFSEDIG